MANQIIKKFIQDGAIDGLKIKLLKDQALVGTLQDGSSVDLIKLDASDKVLVKGVEVGLKSQVDQALVDAKSYADQKITDLVNGADVALDTLKEIGDKLAQDESVVSSLVSTVASNLVEAKGYADTQDAAKLVEAKAYADSVGAAKLVEAKSYTDTQIAAIPLPDMSSAIATAEAYTDAKVVVLNAKDAVIESRQKFLKTAIYNDFAPGYSTGQPGVEDPVTQSGYGLVRDGWYFKNSSAGQSISWYFFDAVTAKGTATKANFNAFAVMTLDAVSTSGEKPILALYSYPTGSNDAFAGFYHSRWSFVLSQTKLNTLTAGKKYLFYTGATSPNVHPELEHIQLDLSVAASQGPKLDSENIGFAMLGSDTGYSVNKVQWLVESLGVEAPDFKLEADLRIRKAKKADLDAEVTARQSADAATLVSAKSYTDAQIAAIPPVDISGKANKTYVDSQDAAKLVEAKAYTDAQIAAIPPVDISGKANITYVDSQDAAKLVEAKAYADAAVLVEKNRAEGVEASHATSLTLVSNRVGVLEAKPTVTFEKESFVAAAPLTDITLANQAIEKSLVVFVGRLALHATDDYTVSVVGGKTKLTWAGDFAVGGIEAIEVGDVIKVYYSYNA